MTSAVSETTEIRPGWFREDVAFDCNRIESSHESDLKSQSESFRLGRAGFASSVE